MIAAGSRVRAKKNDVGVPIGAVGVIERLHEVTGFPVVLFPRSRVVAMLPHQLIDAAAPQPGYQLRYFDPRPLFVTVTKFGLRLSTSADNHMGNPTYVAMRYDTAAGVFAIRPGTIEDELGRGAYMVSRKASGIAINARLFTDLLELGPDGGSVRYAATWSDQDRLLIVPGVAFRKIGEGQ